MKRVLVTGIGGVVGQGILRNIRSFDRDIRLFGTNVEKVSAGNHLCEEVFQVPYAYEQDYVQVMAQICKEKSVDLIIPSTDYEAYYLGLNQHEINCEIAVSHSNATKVSLDKFENFKSFLSANIPFAKSILPSNYNGEFERCIVKPREGRGSRGIVLFPKDPKVFSDENVVQEYLDGPELTSTFYVKKNRTIHGMITFLRELDQGNTSMAEVVFDYDEKLMKIFTLMVEHLDYRGSINVQSRIVNGEIVPFEVNCRISGTNSLRSQFGFPDVEFTLLENLYNEELPQPRITKGVGLRVIKDIIYPNISTEEIRNSQDNFYIY